MSEEEQSKGEVSFRDIEMICAHESRVAAEDFFRQNDVHQYEILLSVFYELMVLRNMISMLDRKQSNLPAKELRKVVSSINHYMMMLRERKITEE